MRPANDLLLLGTGKVAKAVIEQAAGTRKITASTRNPNRIFELVDLGVTPLIMPLAYYKIVAPLAAGADVLVSIAPDGLSDAILAPSCVDARRVIYLSSTGVYGKKSGRIDDKTLPDPSDERMRPRLQAESIWKEHGAIVLRVPGIYGPTSGLHVRLAEGTYKMPARGGNTLSRIHVDDLASIILAIFQANELADSTYLVGDENPCTLAEVVSWLCQEMNLQMPESVSPSEVNPSLRGNRAVDASRIMKELGLSLKYKNYKDGYRQCLQNSSA